MTNTCLKELRTQKKMSLEDVAKQVGVSRQTIWNYENGKRTPSIDQLIPLSDVYGISVKKLIDCLTEGI